MSTAAAIRNMLAMGFTIEQALAAAEAFETASVSTLTKRQERNKRYYEKRKASEKRLNATESTESTEQDVQDAAEPRVAARVVNTQVVKKDTLPTGPSDPTVPMSTPSRRAIAAGWPQDAFARWWAVYPRRVDRGRAEKAWGAMLRRGDVTFDGLMAATSAFARSPPEPQFCPHPATWLNGKRYLDEPDQFARHPQRPESHPGPRRKHTMASVELEEQAWAAARERSGPVGFDFATDERGTLDLGPVGASAFGLDGGGNGGRAQGRPDASVVRLHVAGGR